MNRCARCSRELEADSRFCPACGTVVGSGTDQPSLASEKTSFGEEKAGIDDLIGETVFGYEIVEMVGAGGMGVVYRAVHPKIGKTVAIKFLPPAFSQSPQFVARFEREAVAMVQLSHPNIVAIENMGTHQGQHFLIMEYVPGSTVTEMLEADREAGGGGRLGWGEAVGIGEQVLRALQAAHGQGMLHRDIKPGNILAADDGTVRVADFGLVKVMGIGGDVSIDEARSRLSISAVSDARGAGIGLTALGSPVGTFDYMSPEQYRGERDLDEHTDIYSFGMTLYKMLTGRIARGRAKEPSRLYPEIPTALDDICFKCLEEEPEDRYRNAGEVLAVLSSVAATTAAAERVKIEEEKLAEAARKKQQAAEEELRRQEEARRRAEEQRLREEAARKAEQEQKRHNENRLREEEARKAREEKAWRERDKGGSAFKWVAALLVVSILVSGGYYVYHQEKEKREAAEQARIRAEQAVRDEAARAAEAERLRIEAERKAAAEKKRRNEEAQRQALAAQKAESDRKKKEAARRAEEDRRREAAARAPIVGQEKTVNLGGGVKLTLVWIPPGEFMMGSPGSEANRGSDEGPRHRVKITRGFWMGRYEVTQAQWQAVMGSNPSNFKGSDNPVERVSWNDCQEFIKKLARKTGQRFRLPTEAEWEYACRAGTETVFHYGDSLSSRQANFDGDYPYGGASKGTYLKKTTSVGSYRPNAFGLYDMHGNVWEWCQDWYGNNYYQSSPASNPQGPSSGSGRVLRGGSCYRNAYDCRSALRRGTPDYWFDVDGFRIVFPSSED